MMLIVLMFVLPAVACAIELGLRDFAAIFLGLAGINHARQPERNSRENLAMVTDLVLAGLLVATILLALMRY